MVLDRAGRIEIATETRGAAAFGLDLAVFRFGSAPLTVTGSAAFKAWVVEAGAREDGWARFADPALDQQRQRLVAERRHGQDLADVAAAVAASPALAARFPEARCQTWTPEQEGTFSYEGRAPLRDGTHAVLWGQGGTLFVQRETAALRAETRGLRQGEAVTIGRDGLPRALDQGHGR